MYKLFEAAVELFSFIGVVIVACKSGEMTTSSLLNSSSMLLMRSCEAGGGVTELWW
jgi:hypothetical protein